MSSQYCFTGRVGKSWRFLRVSVMDEKSKGNDHESRKCFFLFFVVFKTRCLKATWPTSVRDKNEWIGRSRQSIGYVNSWGISTHLQCYCVCMYRKRATAEEGLNHPWLNSLPHPHSHPHLHARSASSLDEPETSQSESEPESPAPSPELDLIGSYLMCPGQGELKTGRDAFSFSEPPFPTRPEIQQELICWATSHRWRETEQIKLHRANTESHWAESLLVLIRLGAML